MVEWRAISDFPGYSVSEFGQVHNDVTRQMLRTRPNGQGVMMVGLSRDRHQYMRSLAKLVANAFVEGEHPRFNTVIHLNGDRSDCRYFNLQWRTRPFAIQYHNMFEDEPLRLGVYIPATRERFFSLREACTRYGWVEKIAYRAMQNQEPVFPQGWILEEINP